jgi:predicted acylesterase/phospholipase RssA
VGKVVGIDAGRQRATGTPPQRRRRRPSKTALVLGGGGFTGAVYEIGALRALDLLAVNRTVNDFDVYVGTSAGAFVASMLANGVTPEEMMRAVDRHAPTPFRPFELGTLLRPNYVQYVKKGALLPLKLAGTIRELLPQLRQLSVMDLVVGLGEALPAGVYTGSGIEGYVRDALADPARTDDFRRLDAELYLVATDLDTCERIVFGREGWDDVPISTAVRASTALPMVYAPVEVKGRELVDGGIVSTTNLDIAVEAGAKLIVVVNPLVPYINDVAAQAGPDGPRPRRVSDMGLPQIGFQAFKLMAYQRLHEQARHWQDRYRGVDIVLIEPEPDDELMFQTSIMNYTKRVQIAKHGFQSVTLKLSSDYERFRAICERHGVQISASRLRTVVKHVSAERERTRAWRRILEQTTGALLRQAGAGR